MGIFCKNDNCKLISFVAVMYNFVFVWKTSYIDFCIKKMHKCMLKATLELIYINKMEKDIFFNVADIVKRAKRVLNSVKGAARLSRAKLGYPLAI